MQKSSQSYVQTQFATVGQGELLLMLYDGALRFLAQAKEKMREKDYSAKGVLISRALDIINELDSSLNQQAGGDLSQNLHQLYFLCSTKLLQANLRMDISLVDAVVDILKGLRSAFAQVVPRPEAQAAAQQIAQRQQHSAVPTRRPMAPAPAVPLGANRLHAQSLYGGAAGIDTTQAAAEAAQASQLIAERAAESLTRQAEARAQTAVTQVTAAAEQPLAAEKPEQAPPVAPPVGLGNRRALMAQYGKLAMR